MQLLHLAERRNHKRNLIVKYRQGGVTTLYCIDLLDEALWVPGMSCAILAHERSALTKIFEIVKRAYDNLPDLIKPTTRYDTKNEYQFLSRYDGAPLDSSIYVAMKVRSGTVRKLHITESAYIKDRQELIAGSKQAVPIDGSITEETTGNGFNDFYDAFIEALENKNISPLDYRAYFYAWWQHPEYTLPGECPDKTPLELEIQAKYNLSDGQLLWRRWKKRELQKNQAGLGLSGDQLFMQEYPSNVLEAFQSGAGNVFSIEKILATKPVPSLSVTELWSIIDKDLVQYDLSKKEPLQKLKQLGFELWEPPIIGHRYNIGGDPSDGEGADYSDLDIWDHTNNHQVGQFYGKVRPDELAELAATAGQVYNKAFIGIENNMLTTILFLSKIYDNYYYETRQDEKTLKRTKKIGWNTNTKTRDLMIDEFAIMFDDDSLTIRSKRTLAEMQTFVKKENGKREHADGKHDDSLFGGMIALQMRKFGPKLARVFAGNSLL